MSRRPPVASFVASLLVLALAAGCGGDDDSGEESLSGVRRLEASTTTGDPAASTTGEPADTTVPPIGALRLAEVASVPLPTAMTTDPNTGDLYVAEQTGIVYRIDPASGGSEEIIDISSGVAAGGERGLLGLTFDPTGEHLYLSYTNLDGDTRVDEYAWADGAIVADSKRVILAQDQPFPNHNGGDVHFGPDGYLYFGLGDGGSGGDPTRTGQNPDDLLGSILRIDPAGGGGDAYAVPADNPFADGGGRPEVWLIGVRNPWRFSFDRATGDLWVGDVGQNAIEEIDFLPAVDGADAGRGVNLGWNQMEGTRVFDGEEPDDHVPPIHEYGRGGGNCSVTGGYVYRGAAIPGLDGAYIYGDYCAGELRYLREEGGALAADESLGLGVGSNNLASFGEDLDGEIYVLSNSEGKVYRLEQA